MDKHSLSQGQVDVTPHMTGRAKRHSSLTLSLGVSEGRGWDASQLLLQAAAADRRCAGSALSRDRKRSAACLDTCIGHCFELWMLLHWSKICSKSCILQCSFWPRQSSCRATVLFPDEALVLDQGGSEQSNLMHQMQICCAWHGPTHEAQAILFQGWRCWASSG